MIKHSVYYIDTLHADIAAISFRTHAIIYYDHKEKDHSVNILPITDDSVCYSKNVPTIFSPNRELSSVAFGSFSYWPVHSVVYHKLVCHCCYSDANGSVTSDDQNKQEIFEKKKQVVM